MNVRVGTFNIYWLGHPEKAAGRTAQHIDALGRIVGSLNADVLCFQEVVSTLALADVLARARSSQQEWTFELRSGARVVSGEGGGQQQVAIAWNRKRVKPLEVAVLADEREPPRFARFPVALTVDVRGAVLRVVGLHLKSGQPSYLDEDSANRRLAEAGRVRAWVERLERGHDAPTVVCGDFNGPRVATHAGEEVVAASLEPFRSWPDRRWVDPVDAAGAPAATNWQEGYTIDHFVVGPGLTAAAPPAVVAFDADADLATEMVSDHRPVVLDVTV